MLKDSVARNCWFDERGGTYINLTNGVFHVEKKSLLPHSSKYFSTNQLPFDYLPNTDCLVWKKCLDDWFKDDETKEALRNIFAYVISGQTSTHKAFMLVGEKRGGKGTVSRTLSNLIGKENTCSPRLCSLSGEFGLEPLLGKSLATIGEAELGKRVDGKGVGLIIKSLVGEDSVSVNRKNQKAIESRLRVRFVFSCNAIDDFPDASGALADRFILIHFPNSFLGKENQKLETQLDAEIQGIFNWAIEGLFKELFEPRSSSLQREILRESVSTVAIFFHENLERANGEVVLAADVFLAYQQWCYGRCIEAKERSLWRDFRTTQRH